MNPIGMQRCKLALAALAPRGMVRGNPEALLHMVNALLPAALNGMDILQHQPTMQTEVKAAARRSVMDLAAWAMAAYLALVHQHVNAEPVGLSRPSGELKTICAACGKPGAGGRPMHRCINCGDTVCLSCMPQVSEECLRCQNHEMREA